MKENLPKLKKIIDCIVICIDEFAKQYKITSKRSISIFKTV